jgi:hypothetical protein
MEQVKEVKTSTQKESLYLTTIDLLKRGWTPVQISKTLHISKQKLQYYLSQLSKKGVIKKVGYGTWEVKDFNSNTIAKNKRSIRGHAFIWTIKLPQETKDWVRQLERLKIEYKLVRGIIPRIYLGNKKVWLGTKTITLYEPNSYYGENAVESRKYAVVTLLEDLARLEKELQFNLGKYNFSPAREHYALIKNDLARQCNRNGDKINVSDVNGEWLWIDASDGIGELETGNHNALVNNVGVQKWWNDMKETKFEWTPKIIAENFGKIGQLLEQTTNRVINLEKENVSLKNQLNVKSPLEDFRGSSYIG